VLLWRLVRRLRPRGMRAELIENANDPLDVDCPACGAVQGEPCRPTCIGEAAARDEAEEQAFERERERED